MGDRQDMGWGIGALLILFSACGGAPDTSSSANVAPLTGLHLKARQIDHFLSNYGSWTDDALAIAKRHQLVIVYPAHANLTHAEIAALQAGADPGNPADDVLVLCYVSIGEDLRSAQLTDDQIRGDPRFHGDGSGPRMDPRGPKADGQSLQGIPPEGAPSNGGTGFASYYLDDNDVHNSPDGVGNGFPDRNPVFGSMFVNAGDPAWYKVVDGMTLDSPDGLSGLHESLSSDYGRGLGCDGVFLDTVDTAAPNSYTDASSTIETKFEWTAPGFQTFIRKVHSDYPDKLILQNRGLFFFDPRHPQYGFNARGAIDFVQFESYRLTSSDWELWDPVQYPDNQFNITPKLMAEANRPDGFRVLSLGYAAGPPNLMSTATLTGQSTLGYQDLIDDIHVTQDLAGFRHYLTDAKVDLVNDFVLTHGDLTDHDPPVWTSTYNDHAVIPAVAPTPRVGIQQAEASNGQVTVRWDVALDKNRVDYVLYAQPQPFDFTGDPALSTAERIPLTPAVPDAYVQGVGPTSYPYEAKLNDLPRGQLQYLLIRAVDESPNANQDTNTVVMTVTP